MQCQAQGQQDHDSIPCSTTARGDAQSRPTPREMLCQVSTVSPQGNAGYLQTHREVGDCSQTFPRQSQLFGLC